MVLEYVYSNRDDWPMMVIELSEQQPRHVWPEMQTFNVGVETLTEADSKLYFKNKVEFFSSMNSQQKVALLCVILCHVSDFSRIS